MGFDRRDFLKITGASAGALVSGVRSLEGMVPRIAIGPDAPAIRDGAPEIAVIGAGAFGVWTAYYLREMGVDVVLIDQYGPGNSRATSGGETRGVRTGYRDRVLWTRWASRAIDRWNEWNERWMDETGLQLFFPTGDLAIREEWDNFTTQTRETWEEIGIRHDVLTPEEIEYRWPQINTENISFGLYEYDAVSRLRDSQLGDDRVHDIANYIVKGPLWHCFESDVQPVLLIDEIDKADIEFPNDLLRELDRMEFYVYETQQMVRARHRPIIVITSNNEKELPDAFLRRCFFHYINFPDKETMQQIVEVHFPGLKKELLREAMELFFELRDVPGLKKKPSTSELLDWLKLLMAEDVDPETLRENSRHKMMPPLYGALLKNEQDVHLFERLMFMSRRNKSN
jgi:8-oxo-dGTP pyrophosphatase MutT (NUDIX family)